VSSVTDLIRRHHQSLSGKLSHYAEALAEGVEPNLDSFVAFLEHDLLPHAAGEERALYPRVDHLIRQSGRPTATMSVDHEHISAYVGQIAKTVTELKQAAPSDRATLARHLGRLALRLDAILTLHTEKEERVFLPLIERALSGAEQQKLLAEMHEAPKNHDCCTESVDRRQTGEIRDDQVLDVRGLAPRERHPLILGTFAALRVGEAFVLVNDHDPKPLYYQFQAEHARQFSWDILEQGPEVWRVRIGRAA
jgi:uncharacterized protein (DUF2249 family)/hemerythrin-like domain-containing protein